MKKCMVLLFSFTIVVSLFGGIEQVSAYQGGLLQGKSVLTGWAPFTTSGPIITNPTQTNIFTDGDDTTGRTISTAAGNQYDGIWYEFPEEVSINAYQIKVEGTNNPGKYGFYFFDSEGEEVGLIYPNYIGGTIDLTGTKTSIEPIQNVKKIWFGWGSYGDNPGALKEFDVFEGGTESEPILDVVIPKEKVRVGEKFTADVSLKNVSNIYAEDFKITYNNELLNYEGVEQIPGYKIYNQPSDDDGTLRFIVASQGEQYGITGEQLFLKLKFSGKARGSAKVDAFECRIADTEAEYDLVDSNCTEDTIKIEGPLDVNRSGKYTLVDLAIDGFYFGKLAEQTDTTKHDADQTGDGHIDEEDLVLIVNEILNNSEYPLNN